MVRGAGRSREHDPERVLHAVADARPSAEEASIAGRDRRRGVREVLVRGGPRYPEIKDQGPPFLVPFVAASTDFGWFERWTFALGAFTPSSVGNRPYPASLGFAPNPARYDVVQNEPKVVFGTAAAAVRALPWLDVGLGLHYVIADLHVGAFSGSLGVLARAGDHLRFGANVRGPVSVSSTRPGTSRAASSGRSTGPSVEPPSTLPAPATRR